MATENMDASQPRQKWITASVRNGAGHGYEHLGLRVTGWEGELDPAAQFLEANGDLHERAPGRVDVGHEASRDPTRQRARDGRLTSFGCSYLHGDAWRTKHFHEDVHICVCTSDCFHCDKNDLRGAYFSTVEL